MTFTAYVTEQEKNDRYSKYCQLVQNKTSESVTLAKTQKRFTNIEPSNPIFNAIHKLHSQTPERLNELPDWVRRNLGDTDAIEIEDDTNDGAKEQAIPIRSVVGVQVKGQMRQHHNGSAAGHRRSAASTYSERTGNPLHSGVVSGCIPPTPNQKVSCILNEVQFTIILARA